MNAKHVVVKAQAGLNDAAPLAQQAGRVVQVAARKGAGYAAYAVGFTWGFASTFVKAVRP